MHTPEEAVAELAALPRARASRWCAFPRAWLRPLDRARRTRRAPVAVPGPGRTGSTRSASTASTTTTRCGRTCQRARVRRHVPRRHDGAARHQLVDHQLRRQPRRAVRGRDVPALQVAALRRCDAAVPATFRSRFQECGVSWAHAAARATPSSTGRSATSTRSRCSIPAGSTATSWARTSSAIPDGSASSRRRSLRATCSGSPIQGRTPEEPDEFVGMGVSSKADIVRLFADSFYFGCEADDRGMVDRVPAVEPGWCAAAGGVSAPTSGTGTSPTWAGWSPKRTSWWRRASSPTSSGVRSCSTTRSRCSPAAPDFFEGTMVAARRADHAASVALSSRCAARSMSSLTRYAPRDSNPEPSD